MDDTLSNMDDTLSDLISNTAYLIIIVFFAGLCVAKFYCWLLKILEDNLSAGFKNIKFGKKR